MTPEVLDLRCSAGTCARRGAYVVNGRCGNCGWEGEVIVSKSHENPRRARCPRCECARVDGVGFVRVFEEVSS